ncbi:MAG: quinone-dependent dihydroorotate dehydrogenase [Rhodocyclales bacterium]|nr:quinone-dependent dihydroorotate dehydrogenase [Rhodocyclales bacterium]
MPYCLARPALFALEPETAHDLTIRAFAALGRLLPPPEPPRRAPLTLMGLEFPNRVGLAAGLDKNGEAIDGLARLGFGFTEVGTVTPRPQPGNPKPRLFRLPEARALINRMGFNHDGVDALVARARARRWRGILGINLGKNADTPIERALDDYLLGLRRVWSTADYVTINVSSPNTRALRELQRGDSLEALLGGLREEAERLAASQGKRTPLVLKIAPDLEEAELDLIAEKVLAYRIDGVIATNTTVSREGVAQLPHGQETGGLSGEPLRERATAVLAALAQRLQGRVPLIAAGGILSGDDARAKLRAGASLVQLYTGLIYRGPELVEECLRATEEECCRSPRSPEPPG